MILSGQPRFFNLKTIYPENAAGEKSQDASCRPGVRPENVAAWRQSKLAGMVGYWNEGVMEQRISNIPLLLAKFGLTRRWGRFPFATARCSIWLEVLWIMDLFEAIARRYSYRDDFADVPVPLEDLQKIVQAGIQAPSALNEQVAKFVIVDDPSLLGKIAAVVDRPVCKTAKAMIACVTDNRPVYHGISFDREDCAASVENILLAITALGYATVWLDGALRRGGVDRQVGRLLGVPDDHTVRVLLPIGVAAKPGTQKEKLPLDQRAWFNRFGGKGNGSVEVTTNQNAADSIAFAWEWCRLPWSTPAMPVPFHG